MSGHYGAPLIAGKAVYGTTNLGILGSVIRATTGSGDNGPGILYNDWDSSADDTKYFRALINSGAPAGSFFYEDGTFEIAPGTADGTYTVNYTLFIDGVSQGSTTANILIGVAPSSFAGEILLDNDNITGSFTAGVASIIGGSPQISDDLISGLLTSGSASIFVGNIVLDDDAITGNFATVGVSEFFGNIQLANDIITGNLSSFGMPNPIEDSRVYTIPVNVSSIPVFIKDPDEVLDYGFDPSLIIEDLEGDTVNSHSFISNMPLTILATGIDTNDVYGVLVGGGYNRASALLTCRFTLASGRIIEASIKIKIASK